MNTYTVHLRRHGLDPERDVVLVKELSKKANVDARGTPTGALNFRQNQSWKLEFRIRQNLRII